MTSARRYRSGVYYDGEAASRAESSRDAYQLRLTAGRDHDRDSSRARVLHAEEYHHQQYLAKIRGRLLRPRAEPACESCPVGVHA